MCTRENNKFTKKTYTNNVEKKIEMIITGVKKLK